MLFIFHLQSLTFKFKDKPEDSPSSKNLLLWMVRLIHADPMLMLNVSIINICGFCRVSGVKLYYGALILVAPAPALNY